ncbi:hypothetical protein B0J11DRAFT_310897 [Dendryphion nanum]|uniref:BTB domain-containing protein n=1 Tax=Dendryphion nanum TaxID=256645 RepID=A0A9P9DTC0_9PLEO|nr:hypothetical protein B0J11DRAFT_310897 [Dendryphion nanum]
MSQTIHRIDPNPDTVIILRNPTIDFAPWDSPDPSANDEEALEEEGDDKSPQAETRLEPIGDSSASEVGSTPSTLPGVPDDNHDPLEEDGIRFEVSSRHLMLASPRFKTMLSGRKWQEGVPGLDGRFVIRTEDWDEEAFRILMNVIHTRNRAVPRTIDLDLLAKIAVLVDYYDCSETIELFKDIWIDHVNKTAPAPSNYCRDLMLWVCVAWVFGLEETFLATTEVAMRQSKDCIRALGLPIPPRIIDEIDHHRFQAIESIISQLYDLQEILFSEDYQCQSNSKSSHECGSMLYGVLTKEIHRLGLMSPYPEPPFEGLGFQDLSNKLQTMKKSRWGTSADSQNYRGFVHHTCSVITEVQPMINKTSEKLCGLVLADFLHT